MSTTLTLDASGGLFLPPEVLENAHFQHGAKVEVDVAANRVLVKPLIEEKPVRLVQKGKLLVVTGAPPLTDESVIAAIRAGRDERDERIPGAGDRSL